MSEILTTESYTLLKYLGTENYIAQAVKEGIIQVSHLKDLQNVTTTDC